MSQRKAAAEQLLERLENLLARGARNKKLLEILTVKIDTQIQNPVVRRTALEDIAEIRRIIQSDQQEVNRMIKDLNL